MSVVELMKRYAAVGTVLDKDATRDMLRFCEEGKTTLRILCANVVEDMGDGVMLWQYSSDCTPVKVRAFLKGASVGSSIACTSASQCVFSTRLMDARVPRSLENLPSSA
eukprot:6464265-Amphidinium_carterae.1